MTDFYQTLIKYGARAESVLLFDELDSSLLSYSTLIHARQTSGLGALKGVYTWQQNPLMFLVDGLAIRDSDHLQTIRRCLALYGESPYMGVVHPGRMVVYRVDLDSESLINSEIPLDSTNCAIGSTLSYLGNSRPGILADRRWISQVVLKLLNDALNDLIKYANIGHDDAISLVGRALFTRFLADRHLIPESLIPFGDQQAEDLFKDKAHIERTNRWLDETFNGELLPISPRVIDHLPPAAFDSLSNILAHAPQGQRFLKWEEDWAYLDFALIPVGVLSQAYENYLQTHDPATQRSESGYYTPAPIANLMTRAAFQALKSDGIAHKARVLDPSVGAGVFLLTAFRYLVEERWEHDQQQPDTPVLREILYNQLTGFDINEAALRFTALGLYLLSIELDPVPEPVQKLGFENLRNRVLFKVNGDDHLGSLGVGVGSEYEGCYDLVIGNPPWTSARKLKHWQHVKEMVKYIAEQRLGTEITFSLLPNELMDLPFIWRAMSWAKPKAQIAFALHARLLLQQGDQMPLARTALFQALDVSGIVNGAELRNTKVWPNITAPFCLLFARNQKPTQNRGFRFVSPRFEDAITNTGHLRLDVNNADIVTSEQLAQEPATLKILFRGSSLDLEIIERIKLAFPETLYDYWEKKFGLHKGNLKYSGNGYQKLRNSSTKQARGDGQRGVSADYLWDFPELPATALKSIMLDSQNLDKFSVARMHTKRSPDRFLGPILVIPQTPSLKLGRIRPALVENGGVFSESYYSYSGYAHPDGLRLCRYLSLIFSSQLTLWYILMVCGKFGFERDVTEKVTLDHMPMPSFDDLTAEQLHAVDMLFASIAEQDSDENWHKIDMWVSNLYGLKGADLKIIKDTLQYNLPFAKTRRIAQAKANPAQKHQFCLTLNDELQPWVDESMASLQVDLIAAPLQSAWDILRIRSEHEVMQSSKPEISTLPLSDWPAVLNIADSQGSTEVLHFDHHNKQLWIARLAQARYWTDSQAKLLAQRIIWEHLEDLLDEGAMV